MDELEKKKTFMNLSTFYLDPSFKTQRSGEKKTRMQLQAIIFL